MHGARFRSGGRSISAHQTFDPDQVSITNCGPNDGSTVNINSPAIDQYVEGYHEWTNDNPNSDVQSNKAYVRAQVTIDGQPIPVEANTDHPYRRQVDPTTYEMMIGEAGAIHTISFLMPVDSLPMGEDMAYGVNVLQVERRPLQGF